MAFFIVLEVKGRVDKGKVGEKPFGRNFDSQLEQIVVGIAGIVVDPFLHLEDVDGENRSLAISEARFGGKQDVSRYHPALRRSVSSVV